MNSSRMNRLEELGRVDSEKAFTKKGKRNLDEKSRMLEKSRIVHLRGAQVSAKQNTTIKTFKIYRDGGMVSVSGRGQGKVMSGRNKKTYIC